MARKNNTPILTHTEILCYALRALEAEIEDWKKRCAQLNPADRDEMLQRALETRLPKLETLKELYRTETGVEYCG